MVYPQATKGFATRDWPGALSLRVARERLGRWIGGAGGPIGPKLSRSLFNRGHLVNNPVAFGKAHFSSTCRPLVRDANQRTLGRLSRSIQCAGGVTAAREGRKGPFVGSEDRFARENPSLSRQISRRNVLRAKYLRFSWHIKVRAPHSFCGGLFSSAVRPFSFLNSRHLSISDSSAWQPTSCQRRSASRLLQTRQQDVNDARRGLAFCFVYQPAVASDLGFLTRSRLRFGLQSGDEPTGT